MYLFTVRKPACAVVLTACLLSFNAALAAAPKTKLTKADAQKIALSKENGTVKSGELEHEKGRWIYSFDINKGAETREVNVDANSGAVVEDSLDTPADEAKEAAAEAKKAPKQ